MIVDYVSLLRALRRGPLRPGPVPPGYEEDAVCLLLLDRSSPREHLAAAPRGDRQTPPNAIHGEVHRGVQQAGTETMLLAVQKADNEGYHWRNHVALPGGRIDPSDRHARDAALRELEEELSIERSEVEVLGSMGHFQTESSRNDLEVIVGRWTRPAGPCVDRREIERAFELPLARMVNLHLREGFRSRDAGSIGRRLVYPLPDVDIWGVTARILHHFLELVLDHKILAQRSA